MEKEPLSTRSPDGPKNENFQQTIMGFFMFSTDSLGVGKRQTDEVSLKSALIGPFKALPKMLKTSSSGFKRNSPNIIFLHYEKKYTGENENHGSRAPQQIPYSARFSRFQSQFIAANVPLIINLWDWNVPYRRLSKRWCVLVA